MNESMIAEIKSFKAKRERLLGRLLNKTYRHLSDLASDFLRNLGYQNFRVGHIVALVHIEFEGTSVNKLAEGAGMTKQGMSKLIKELVTEGFVKVKKDPADARALIVNFTDKGIQAVCDWKKCTEHINLEFTKILGDEKLETLKDILLELVNHYEAKHNAKYLIGLDHKLI